MYCKLASRSNGCPLSRFNINCQIWLHLTVIAGSMMPCVSMGHKFSSIYLSRKHWRIYENPGCTQAPIVSAYMFAEFHQSGFMYHPLTVPLLVNNNVYWRGCAVVPDKNTWCNENMIHFWIFSSMVLRDVVLYGSSCAPCFTKGLERKFQIIVAQMSKWCVAYSAEYALEMYSSRKYWMNWNFSTFGEVVTVTQNAGTIKKLEDSGTEGHARLSLQKLLRRGHRMESSGSSSNHEVIEELQIHSVGETRAILIIGRLKETATWRRIPTSAPVNVVDAIYVCCSYY